MRDANEHSKLTERKKREREAPTKISSLKTIGLDVSITRGNRFFWTFFEQLDLDWIVWHFGWELNWTFFLDHMARPKKVESTILAWKMSARIVWPGQKKFGEPNSP